MSISAYTPEELKKLGEAVMVSGMAVSLVDVGVVSTAIEAAAMAKEISGAASRYPSNGIIQALFSKDAIKQDEVKQALKLDVKAEEMKPEVAIDTAVTAIQAAMGVLAAKASPAEAEDYKQFIYHCAEQVANAAGNGLFGTGSTKVSSTEAAALTRIKTALGI